MVSGYNRIKMETRKYDIEKTYQIVRMKFSGFSIAIPHRTECGGIACRTLPFEMIEYGGKILRCAKDHQEKVTYIDTHTMEEEYEGGS